MRIVRYHQPPSIFTSIPAILQQIISQVISKCLWCCGTSRRYSSCRKTGWRTHTAFTFCIAKVKVVQILLQNKKYSFLAKFIKYSTLLLTLKRIFSNKVAKINCMRVLCRVNHIDLTSRLHKTICKIYSANLQPRIIFLKKLLTKNYIF